MPGENPPTFSEMFTDQERGTIFDDSKQGARRADYFYSDLIYLELVGGRIAIKGKISQSLPIKVSCSGERYQL